ncbi:MAG: cytochrome c biogenesis protein CcsA [Bacteroidetes bacterium]|nr:cytochrome c biogenesis protein CcsA [Bacteroidota bacterium]
MTVVITAGFLMSIPKIDILEHTARNLYFHVPMWFTMMAAAIVSVFHSIRHLRKRDIESDLRAAEAARVALLFGFMGITTGVVWAKVTWYQGTSVWWNFDPRQTSVAIELMVYSAYFVLRSSFEDSELRGRISAAYNVFAFTTMPFLLYVLPRQLDSLHPGAEGNPAFSEITDPRMRLVFYPAIIGFMGLFWILYTQRVRYRLLKNSVENRYLNDNS